MKAQEQKRGQFCDTVLCHAAQWYVQGLSKTRSSSLASVPFIPVCHNTRLAAPQDTFFRLRRPLDPFAFEVPASFAQHADLLKSLGCRDEPSAQDFLDIITVSWLCYTYQTLFMLGAVLSWSGLTIHVCHAFSVTGRNLLILTAHVLPVVLKG